MFESKYKKSLLFHICLYPYLKFEDIYKFLLQAVCGNLHVLESKEKFIQSLYKEAQIIKDEFTLKENRFFINIDIKNMIEKQSIEEIEIEKENLIEYLREDKKYTRLNLRPYIKLNFDMDILKEACFSSAENNINREKLDKEEFQEIWTEFIKTVFNQSFFSDCEQYCQKFFPFSPISKDKTKEFFKINLSIESLEKFNNFIVSKNYPIIHHSQEYLSLYRPAYRVLELNELKSKLKLNS